MLENARQECDGGNFFRPKRGHVAADDVPIRADEGQVGGPCLTGQYGALVALPCKTGRHLVGYAVTDFQPELKNKNLWYVPMGSGQSIIDPFLGMLREVFWGDDPPTVQDAIFATTWMLDHAVKVNPGGVNALIRIAVLEQIKGDGKARLLSDEELHEHETGVIAAKDTLRNFRERLVKDEGAVEIPPAPEVLISTQN